MSEAYHEVGLLRIELIWNVVLEAPVAALFKTSAGKMVALLAWVVDFDPPHRRKKKEWPAARSA